MRDKMRERGFEDVAGKLPAGHGRLDHRSRQKQQQRRRGDRAIAVWRATRTSS